MQDLKFIRCTGNTPDFIDLVHQLDHYLAIVDGEEHAFYNQYNGSSDLEYCLLAYLNDKPVACGAIRPFDGERIEIKRMFTLPSARKKGLAQQLISGLEKWAEELGFNRVILETGKRQEDAVRFYLKAGYLQTVNYPPYEGVDNSVCFEKLLK